jgi:hypothetical protein
MKTIFTSVLLLTLLTLTDATNAQAQMIFEEGAYYQQAGQTDCQCGPVFTVTMGFDFYGRPIMQAFQDCRERRWYNWQGGTYGYVWVNCFWQSNYQVRTWWAYNWFDFRRRVY